MDKISVPEKIKSYSWHKWLQRPYDCFMLSIFQEGIKQEYFEKIGVPGVCCRAIFYQNGFWYESPEIFQEMKETLVHYLEHHSIFEITASLPHFHRNSKKSIRKLIKQKQELLQKLQEVYEIITTATTYIWLAHGLEEYYKERLLKEVPKYISHDFDLFIGDASFPRKKNAHAVMEEAMRKGMSFQKIAKRFGWLRMRDVFSDPFTEGEIEAQIKNLSPHRKIKRVKIPLPLRSLFKEVQELVYFRTARTDVFFELLYEARPIFAAVAEQYHLPVSELRHYTIQSLLSNNPKKYYPLVAFASYNGIGFYSQEPVLQEIDASIQTSVQGLIAYKGIAQGHARIVKTVAELDKVKEGDVFITQMTFPSFIIAMQKAVAFVTDEGGITCHAAIVAREMQKPCVIGTKNATKTFHDNDLVEVDAEKGIVRKIEQTNNDKI